jgi:hypothetical protein
MAQTAPTERQPDTTSGKNGFLGITRCVLGITLNSGICSNESAQFLSLWHSWFPSLSRLLKKFCLGITKYYFLGIVPFISHILTSNFPIKASTC